MSDLWAFSEIPVFFSQIIQFIVVNLLLACCSHTKLTQFLFCLSKWLALEIQISILCVTYVFFSKSTNERNHNKNEVFMKTRSWHLIISFFEPDLKLFCMFWKLCLKVLDFVMTFRKVFIFKLNEEVSNHSKMRLRLIFLTTWNNETLSYFSFRPNFNLNSHFGF